MPDEVTEAIINNARMIKHHGRWLHYRVLKRNGRIPPEISRAITESIRMMPHHVAYFKGAMKRNGEDMASKRYLVSTTVDSKTKYWNSKTLDWGTKSSATKFTAEDARKISSENPKKVKLVAVDSEQVKLKRNGLNDQPEYSISDRIRDRIRDVRQSVKTTGKVKSEQVKMAEKLIDYETKKYGYSPDADNILRVVLREYADKHGLNHAVFKKSDEALTLAEVESMIGKLKKNPPKKPAIKRNSSEQLHEANMKLCDSYKTDDKLEKMFVAGFKYASNLASQGEVKADATRLRLAYKAAKRKS